MRHPDRATRAYARELGRIVVVARRLLEREVLRKLGSVERAAGIRQDAPAWVTALAGLFRTVRQRMAEVVSPEYIERLAQGAAGQTSEFNKAEMTRQLRASVGVDIFLADPLLRQTIADFVTVNVSLIKSIPEQYFGSVEKIITTGFRKGQRAEALAPKIAQRFGVTQRRARFIARDQIAKLNGQLTENRQIELGIDSYIWRTSRDERVRESHRELEGTLHKWSDPPTTSEGRTVHPGEDFNCRCTAEPVIPGVAAIRTSPRDVPRDEDLVRRFRNRQ